VGKLAASILSADHARLAAQVKLVDASADVIHVDVMDAHFVPPLTIGAVVVASLRPHTDRIVQGHLRVRAPERLFEDLAKAGTDVVSFHVEAVDDRAPVIERARVAGMGVGIAMNTQTPLETVLPSLEEVDEILFAGNGPSGRPLDDAAFEAIERARAEIDRRDLSIDIHVEGGVTVDNARRLVEAGADVLVAGSAIFGAADAAASARDLKAIASGEA
jgi:ribulose-phosphate 3-epimerase